MQKPYRQAENLSTVLLAVSIQPPPVPPPVGAPGWLGFVPAAAAIALFFTLSWVRHTL